MLQMPDHWTREDAIAWRRLQNRLPGIGKDVERLVCKMAVETGHGGQVFIDYSQQAEGFSAMLEIHLPAGIYARLDEPVLRPVAYPVIPDRANPDGKTITPGMLPFVFNDIKECRENAEEGKRILVKQIRQAEANVRTK